MAAAAVTEKPEERAKAGADLLTKEFFPQGIPKPAGMAGEVVRGLAESWPALLALGALAPLGSVPAFAAWGLTEEKPLAGAVKGAAFGGALSALGIATAPIANPVARWVTRIAGAAGIGGGATALEGGGPTEISRDALIFGLFETWGLARSGEWRGFFKEKGVPEADVKTLEKAKTTSPEFVEAMNNAAAQVIKALPPAEGMFTMEGEPGTPEELAARRRLKGVPELEEQKAVAKQVRDDAAKIQEIQKGVEERLKRNQPLGKAGTTPPPEAAEPPSGVISPAPEPAASGAVAEVKTPDQPMGKAGPDAEQAAGVKTEEKPPVITPAPGEIVQPGAAGEVGKGEKLTSEEIKEPWKLPAPKKRVYDMDKAQQRGDIASLVRGYGGFRSDSRLIKSFTPEEQRRIRLLSNKDKSAVGPDVLLEDLKAEYPHIFGQFDDAADLLRAIGNGDIYKHVGSVEEEIAAHDREIEEQAAGERFDAETLRQADLAAQREVETEEAPSPETRGPEPGAAEPEPDLASLSYEDLAARYGGETPPKYAVRGLPPEERLAALQESPLWQTLTPEQQDTLARGGERGDLHPALKQFLQEMTAPGMVQGTKEPVALYPPGWQQARFKTMLDTLEGRVRPSITEADVRRAFPTATKITESNALKLQGLYDGFQVDLPGGKRIIVRRDEFIMPLAESLEAGYGKPTLGPGEYAAGEYRKIDRGGMITLAKGEGAGTLDHESFHSAMDLALTDREKAAVLRQYGDEEAAARAYEAWSPAEQPHTFFQKIVDFFRQIYRGLFPDAESVFAKVRAGEVWGRGEKALPEALAPARYQVREEGESEGFYQGVLSYILPSGKSEAHLRAAETMRQPMGEWQRRAERANETLNADRTWFDKQGVSNPAIPIDQNIGLKFASDMAMGRPMTPELQKVADKVEAGFQERIGLLDKVGAPLQTVREDYFPGIYQQASIRAFNQALREAIDAGRGRVASEGEADRTVMDLNLWSDTDKTFVRNRVDELLAQGQGSDRSMVPFLTRRPLKGQESFRKPKVFDDHQTAVEFGLRPVSNNPIDQVLLKYREMDKSIADNQALREYERKGDIITVGLGGQPLKKGLRADFNPAEWHRIDDAKYGEIKHINSDTKVLELTGYRLARKPVAKILNNYLSKVLYSNPAFGGTYSKIMALGNSMNQAELGMGSLFHGGTTILNAQIMAGARVLQDAYGAGRGSRSFGDLARSIAKFPTAMAETPRLGTKVLAEYRNPSMEIATDVPVGQMAASPEARLAQVAKFVEMAGGAFEMDPHLRTQQTQKMIQDWYGGQKLRAAMRSPIAFLELSMKPAMEWIVPRIKAGTFAEKVGRLIEQNPSKTINELRGEAGQAWNEIDAILGQVRYDRLFMNNTAKNVMQAIIRAPGWTGGTIAWVGGAPIDLGRFISEWVRTGKAPANLPDKVAYTISLLGGVALVNGLMTYALTGQSPQDIRDFFAFRDGGVDAQGNPTRWLLPTYAKDIFGYWENPGHTILAKTHPLISTIGDVIRGTGYYGQQIRDPEAGYARQALDTGLYGVKAYEPFWIKGLIQGSQPEGMAATLHERPEKIISPLVGIMPAAKAYTESNAQKVMDRYSELMRGTTTKETQETRSLKSDLMRLARAGDQDGFQESASDAVSTGKLTRQQVKQIAEESQLPPGQSRFYRLPLEWAARAMEAGSDYEREQWTPLLLQKIKTSKPEMLIRNREPLVALLRELGQDEVADRIESLEMPAEPLTGINLTGLGMLKPPAEASPMEDVVAAIDKNLARVEAPGRQRGSRTPRAIPGLMGF